MQALLGAVGFCHPWIAAFEEMAKPLLQIIAQDAAEAIHWTTDKVKTFKLLKQAAPALGLRDCSKQFTLFIQEGQGIASGMVTNTLNPATLLPSPGEGTPHHDCVVTTREAEKTREDLTDVPFLNPNLELFVGGSSYCLSSNWVTGYSITTVNEVVEASSLSLKLSAQAELIALTKVYQLAKEKTVNIYAKPEYAFGVYHATRQLQKLHGFITSNGSKISNAPQVTELLKAIQLPEKLAIIHRPVHAGRRTKAEIRNSLTDIATKATAQQLYEPPDLQSKGQTWCCPLLKRYI